METIRVGMVGLGANTRLRHVPGLRACPGVEVIGVCNRSADSTRTAAEEFQIPRTYRHWTELVADPDVDAVVIGTWPYLHRDITIAALEAGKHVLTEARMARDAAEAREMLHTSQRYPHLVAQIVPSPFGLQVDQVVKDLLASGFLGELREAVVLGTHAGLADPATPFHWRQSKELSGLNMLTLGILHETLVRWVPDPTRVLAQTQIFTPRRMNPQTNELQPVGTPDSVHVLTELPGGARGLYHISGVLHHGPGTQIHLYGSEGTLQYRFVGEDELLAARRSETRLQPLPIPPEKRGGWRVEEEFIEAIRGKQPIRFTDFATGVRYMEFTEAVARSAAAGRAVSLPLADAPL